MDDWGDVVSAGCTAARMVI